MNKEQAKERAQVMLAWAEGKKVQFRGRNGTFLTRWMDGNSPGLEFDFDANEYRIKPAPVERWGIANDNGFITTCGTETDAKTDAKNWGPGVRYFLMREVIEE